ncbi:hypothetical protein CC77DRAFT_141154 [Alternaria alternata]|uniref:Uncharacterized protein n=1 Tax=Alternaria alternata TaxID=5599 RepID=A0A177DKH4_ALTAL|nr:hypothetical protein CC77DRAFT_141154 [Alternaria alternata]OAG19798.1 hypothetical protein CC77DRAFT_141154 [Alternaria alternata]
MRTRNSRSRHGCGNIHICRRTGEAVAPKRDPAKDGARTHYHHRLREERASCSLCYHHSFCGRSPETPKIHCNNVSLSHVITGIISPKQAWPGFPH